MAPNPAAHTCRVEKCPGEPSMYRGSLVVHDLQLGGDDSYSSAHQYDTPSASINLSGPVLFPNCFGVHAVQVLPGVVTVSVSGIPVARSGKAPYPLMLFPADGTLKPRV